MRTRPNSVRSRITGMAFGEDVTLVREALGARNEYGEWVPGAPVESTIRVTWQPAPGKDRWSNFARVVEEGGLRLEGLAVVYSTVELVAAGRRNYRRHPFKGRHSPQSPRRRGMARILGRTRRAHRTTIGRLTMTTRVTGGEKLRKHLAEQRRKIADMPKGVEVGFYGRRSGQGRCKRIRCPGTRHPGKTVLSPSHCDGAPEDQRACDRASTPRWCNHGAGRA